MRSNVSYLNTSRHAFAKTFDTAVLTMKCFNFILLYYDIETRGLCQGQQPFCIPASQIKLFFSGINYFSSACDSGDVYLEMGGLDFSLYCWSFFFINRNDENNFIVLGQNEFLLKI